MKYFCWEQPLFHGDLPLVLLFTFYKNNKCSQKDFTTHNTSCIMYHVFVLEREREREVDLFSSVSCRFDMDVYVVVALMYNFFVLFFTFSDWVSS